MKRMPLVMTASISTRGMKGAMFSDEERERQYLGALLFYSDKLLKKDPERKIVFMENSGHDLTNLVSQVPKQFLDRIEFISLNPEHFDISKGKGYNELLMLKLGVGGG